MKPAWWSAVAGPGRGSWAVATRERCGRRRRPRSPATLYRILRGTTPGHVEFREDVRRVETELELHLAGTVTQAAFSDPRLALSLLERRFGERWGRRAALLAGADEQVASGSAASGVVVLEPAILQTIVPG